MRRLRAGELPGRHHGAALPAVHHYDRRVGHHLHRRGADAQSGDVRLFPAPRQRTPQTQTVPAYQLLAAARQYGLPARNPRQPAPFAADAGGLRHPARRHLADEPHHAAEFHAQGGPGLFHRRAGTSRRGDARTDASCDGSCDEVPDGPFRRGVCAQCDGVVAPTGQQSGAQPADGDSQTVGRPYVGEHRRTDGGGARRAVALSREQGLPKFARRHPGSGYFGRLRDGARSARRPHLYRLAAGRRHADVLR